MFQADLGRLHDAPDLPAALRAFQGRHPGFDARVAPIDPARAADDDRASRWDRESVHAFEGTYGDYLLNKVSRVFPQLRRDAIGAGD